MRTAASLAGRTFTVTVGLCVALLATGAARGAGPVVRWGLGAPPPMISASAIDVSSVDHSCAIQAGSGAVVCWGNNGYLQATPPASVNGIAGAASAIAAGGRHTLAIAAPLPLSIDIKPGSNTNPSNPSPAA